MMFASEKYQQRILTWAYVGLWIFVSAFLWAPSRDGLEGVYALMFFIPLLLVLPWRKPDMQMYGGGFTGIALLYTSWSLLTGLWGNDLGYLLLQWLVLATWLAGSAWVLQKKSVDWDRFLRCMLWVGAVTALVNIAVFYWSNPWSSRLEGVTVARAPTLVGQVYGLVVLIGILLSWRTNSFQYAIGFSAACIPALAALGLSQSRGPLLSLAGVLLIGIFWLRPGWKILLTQIATGLLSVGVLIWLMLDDLLFERGVSLRDQIWFEVLQQMLSDPTLFLWGIGMSESTDIITSVGEYHHAHNAWLDIFYRTGIVGLGLALVHFCLLLWTARGYRNVAPLTLWLIYGCGCLLVDSRSLFWEIDVKWLLYWIPAGLLAASLMRLQPDRKIDG
jgi:hypothetical protein